MSNELNGIYRDNRKFFLRKENVFFFCFLFLSACTFKLNKIDSLGMGYEAMLYFMSAWILFARVRIYNYSYFTYGFIMPFIVSLALICLRMLFGK